MQSKMGRLAEVRTRERDREWDEGWQMKTLVSGDKEKEAAQRRRGHVGKVRRSGNCGDDKATRNEEDEGEDEGRQMTSN